MAHLADAAGCRGFRIGVDMRNAAGRRNAQQSQQQAHDNQEPAESYLRVAFCGHARFMS
jgi:hypothetical protein